MARISTRAFPFVACLLLSAACGGEARTVHDGEGNLGGASESPPHSSDSAGESGIPGASGAAAVANAGAAGAMGPQEPEVASFEAVQSRILSHCSGGFFSCHGRDPFDAELDLTAGKAYDSLVGHPAFVDASIVLVQPGDAAHSLLWRKLAGELPADDSLGARMPIESSWQASAADLDLMRRWIDEGALR